MTLVFPGWGKLLQIQIGANELASSILVSRFVGSIASRPSDAKVFEALALEYRVIIKSLPSWLQNISLDRKGVVLGQNQRDIHVQNTMLGIRIRSLEGIATFIVLILYHVEPVEVILAWIEGLILGKYQVVSGGDLEGGEKNLPFATQDLLRRFVDGVRDADVKSEQNDQCLQWVKLLTKVIGSSDLPAQSTRFSQEHDQRFLERLPDSRGSQDSLGPEFHTIPAGSAMIAFAARANGANVCVKCMTEHEDIIIPAESEPFHYQDPLTVCLWLKQPPTEVIAKMGLGLIGESFPSDTGSPSMLPAYGGTSEIAPIVARQFGYKGTQEEIVALWQEAETAGKSVAWRCTRDNYKGSPNHGGIKLFFDDAFLESNIPASIAQLADGYFSVPRSDRRHKLARKAACVYHKVFQYNDYVKDDNFHASLKLILVAMAVGCLRSLTKDPHGRLSTYSWVADCTGSRSAALVTCLCERLANEGLPANSLLLAASYIWGGGVMDNELTIVLNVLVNAQDVARFGLSKGLLTLYQGSVPMLPRDPATGYIVAGIPYNRRARQQVARQTGSSSTRMEGSEQLVLTLEPYLDRNGALTALLCAWHGGGVAFELDAHTIFCNLLHRRGLYRSLDHPSEQSSRRSSREAEPSTRKRSPRAHTTRGKRPNAITRHELLQRGLSVCADHSRATVAVGPRLEWQVVAAGCVENGKAILIQDEEEAGKVYDAGWEEQLSQIELDEGHDTKIILGCEEPDVLVVTV